MQKINKKSLSQKVSYLKVVVISKNVEDRFLVISSYFPF